MKSKEDINIERIKQLFARSKGNDDKLLQLTKAMANSIDNIEKAIGRAKAAEKLLGKEDNPLAEIFYNRAKELDNSSKISTEEKDFTLPRNTGDIVNKLPFELKSYDKPKGIMVLPTMSAVYLWENEIKGQLSDGAWENAYPHDHWKYWSEVYATKAYTKPVVYSFQGRPKKDSYSLTSLLQYVGDRMLAIGVIANFNKPIDSDTWEIEKNVNKYAHIYDIKALRKDLGYIKSAMKNIQFLENATKLSESFNDDLTDFEKEVIEFDEDHGPGGYYEKEYLRFLDNKINRIAMSSNDADSKRRLNIFFKEYEDITGEKHPKDRRYVIKIRSEIQESVVENLMFSGRSFYPDMYAHDRVWANDLMENGIVSIIDGIMMLKVSPKDLTVLGPNNDIVRYAAQR